MAGKNQKVPVIMYDGAIVMAPRGTSLAKVIRRYYMNKHYDLIGQLEKDNGLPQGLLLYLVDRESKFNPKAVSKSNAKGLGQLIAKWHPGVDVWDEVANLTRAAEYLAEMQAEFKDWRKTLAGYNQGPTKTRRIVREFGENWLSHPDIKKETRDYVEALGPKAEQPTPRERTGPINPRGAAITSNIQPAIKEVTKEELQQIQDNPMQSMEKLPPANANEERTITPYGKMSKLSPGIYLDEDSGKYFNIGENGSMEELSA